MRPAQYRAMEIRHKRDLMHHGIDGQKWGVKHGPPYPLDDSKSTGSRLKKGAKAKSHSRAGHIAKSAAAGAALGGVVGTLAFGPVSGIASAGASAIASSIRAAHNTKPKLGNKKAAKPKKKSASDKYMERHKDEYEAKRKEREEKYKKEMEQYKNPEFRKKKYADAKNDDMFDFNFLENWHLNSYYHDETKDPSKEETLREYKRYLQDPEKWLREGHSGSR